MSSANLIHHTNASETRERGSTALKYGADNALLLQKTDETVTLSSVKNKDMDPFPPVTLKLTKVPGSDSCIVRLASAVVAVGGLSPSQRQALDAPVDGLRRGGGHFAGMTEGRAQHGGADVLRGPASPTRGRLCH